MTKGVWLGGVTLALTLGGIEPLRGDDSQRVLTIDLYADLGAKQKVLVDLGCASHNAMWERNHQLLFKASLEWLQAGTVNGASEGVVRMGY